MIYFIVNKTSQTGSGIKNWYRVREILKSKKIEYKVAYTKYKGHATELATRISSLPYDTIQLVVVGGDGTINEVINGIKDFSKILFGVIPTGSGNDFAAGLGITGSFEDRVDKIIRGKPVRKIDIGKVSYNESDISRYFSISSGMGLDAIVCKKALTSKQKKLLNKLHLGKLTYLLLTVETLFTMETVPVKVNFDGKESLKLDKMIFAAGMNFVAEGGGVPMAPGADASDGKLSCCIAHGLPKWKAFFALPFLVMAKHEKMSCFYIKNCEECSFVFAKPVVLHADGEYVGDVKRVKMSCLQGALSVVV